MKLVYRLDEDGGISTYQTQSEASKAAALDGGSTFESYAGLAAIAGREPVQLLVDCWNSLPGVTPVKRFKDRSSAVKRIWAVIEETLAPTMRAALYPEQAPKATKSIGKALRETREVTLTIEAPALPEAEAAPQQEAPAPSPAREGSKKAQALEMLRNGTTREALQTAFGWLPHTTRGFLSILGKTHKIEATKGQDGIRYYRLVA
jgi:hypothetical protein